MWFLPEPFTPGCDRKTGEKNKELLSSNSLIWLVQRCFPLNSSMWFSGDLMAPSFQQLSSHLQKTPTTFLSWPSMSACLTQIRPKEFWIPVSTLKLSEEVEGFQFQIPWKHKGYAISSLRSQKLSCPWQRSVWQMPGTFQVSSMTKTPPSLMTKQSLPPYLHLATKQRSWDSWSPSPALSLSVSI